MTIEQVTEKVKAFEAARAAFDSLKTMNTFRFNISLDDKVVFECDGKICRISPAYDAAIRLGILKMFEGKGFYVFQPEIEVPEASTRYLTTTLQEKVTPANFKTRAEGQDELFKRYNAQQQKEMRELFERLRIIGWSSHDNCGYDKDGNLKIFDYVANVSVREMSILTDSHGEVLAHV